MKRAADTLNQWTMLRVVTLFWVLLASGCTYWPSGTYFRHGVGQYRGEGTIHDVSQPSLFFGSRGYVVELEKFDLGSSYDKQFGITNLPTIANGPVEICLAVEDEEISRLGGASVDTLRKKLNAALAISLTDSAGATVAD